MAKIDIEIKANNSADVARAAKRIKESVKRLNENLRSERALEAYNDGTGCVGGKNECSACNCKIILVSSVDDSTQKP